MVDVMRLCKLLDVLDNGYWMMAIGRVDLGYWMMVIGRYLKSLSTSSK